MARDFASRFHRQMVAGFAGDLAPADPMAAGLTWVMALRRQDDTQRSAKTLQAYYRTNAAITISAQLWLHADGTNWLCTVSPLVLLAAIPPLTGFEYPGKLDDALVFLLVIPSAPLGAGETIDLYMEETDAIEEVGLAPVGLRLVP
jgi:hypothetical protein